MGKVDIATKIQLFFETCESQNNNYPKATTFCFTKGCILETKAFMNYDYISNTL